MAGNSGHLGHHHEWPGPGQAARAVTHALSALSAHAVPFYLPVFSPFLPPGEQNPVLPTSPPCHPRRYFSLCLLLQVVPARYQFSKAECSLLHFPRVSQVPVAPLQPAVLSTTPMVGMVPKPSTMSSLATRVHSPNPAGELIWIKKCLFVLFSLLYLFVCFLIQLSYSTRFPPVPPKEPKGSLWAGGRTRMLQSSGHQ